jgi:hypothetical protein
MTSATRRVTSRVCGRRGDMAESRYGGIPWPRYLRGLLAAALITSGMGHAALAVGAQPSAGPPGGDTVPVVFYRTSCSPARTARRGSWPTAARGRTRSRSRARASSMRWCCTSAREHPTAAGWPCAVSRGWTAGRQACSTVGLAGSTGSTARSACRAGPTAGEGRPAASCPDCWIAGWLDIWMVGWRDEGDDRVLGR